MAEELENGKALVASNIIFIKCAWSLRLWNVLVLIFIFVRIQYTFVMKRLQRFSQIEFYERGPIPVIIYVQPYRNSVFRTDTNKYKQYGPI